MPPSLLRPIISKPGTKVWKRSRHYCNRTLINWLGDGVVGMLPSLLRLRISRPEIEVWKCNRLYCDRMLVG